MSMMEFARQGCVRTLYEPRDYRVGKATYVELGAAKTARETLLDVKGRGVLKHIWTTHKLDGTHLKLYIFVDGAPEPLLGGFVHELASAAERISRPEIPLGGFFNRRSANLYLPVPFSESLRIEAEPDGETGGGPFWQIDYALDCDEAWPLPRQATAGGRTTTACDFPPAPAPDPGRPLALLDEDVELTNAGPHNLWLEGGGIIRRLEISGKALDSLLLRIAFDGERVQGDEGWWTADRLDGPFQVDAPLRYLAGPFNNACVERRGSTAVIHFPMPYRQRAGIQLLAAMDYGSVRETYLYNVRVHYETTTPPPERMGYFHARFRSEMTRGYDDFEVCSTRGHGHFVGVHIFDTGHDHGGGDNIMFDGRTESAGQLHGVNAEDYFHMAWARPWYVTPYSGCPSHTARYRYHLEMPVPFRESFVFNWGSFASQPAKAVAFWYQQALSPAEPEREWVYTVTGPFDLDAIDDLKPGAPFPPMASPRPIDGMQRPVRSWTKTAQQCFVDLCHIDRRYVAEFPPGPGLVSSGICTCAETRLWAAREAEMLFLLGCDDPIRLYVNGDEVFRDDGRRQPDAFKVFKPQATLRGGLNVIRVVVGNTPNCNWHWNGFSLALQNDLTEEELLCMV